MTEITVALYPTYALYRCKPDTFSGLNCQFITTNKIYDILIAHECTYIDQNIRSIFIIAHLYQVQV